MHALRKDANWLEYVKLRPENEPTQQKKWTILRQKKNIDPLLKMQAHFLHVSDSDVSLYLNSPRNENLNLLVQIISLNIFLYSSKKKPEKFTCPNKGLLVLGWGTGAHREDCI
jgi:hypothetical protein